MRRAWLWVVPTVVVAAALVGVVVASLGGGDHRAPVSTGEPSVVARQSASPAPTLDVPTLPCTASQLQGTVVYRPSVAGPMVQSRDGKATKEQFPFEVEVVNMSKTGCVMLSSPAAEWTHPRGASGASLPVTHALTDAAGQAPLPAGAGVFAAVEVGVPVSCGDDQAADDGMLALTVVEGEPAVQVPMRRLADCAASGPMVMWPFTPDLAAADRDLKNAGWVIDPRLAAGDAGDGSTSGSD